MNKKILDFPEAAELANDDYIIFDSESGGGCRILGKTIAPVIYGIEATYTQTQEVTVDTPLDDLRQDLVVEAIYQHNRKKAVTDYTLSGTLSAGTSVVTVTYEGFTTTFNVTVTAATGIIANWEFGTSQSSLIDTINGYQLELGGTYSSADRYGIICAQFRSDKIQYLKIPSELYFDYTDNSYNSLTYEFDIQLCTGSAQSVLRMFCMSSAWGGSSDPFVGLYINGYTGNPYYFRLGDGTNLNLNFSLEYINAKTSKVKIEKIPNNQIKISYYLDDVLYYESAALSENYLENYKSGVSLSSFKYFADMLVSGLRVITG